MKHDFTELFKIEGDTAHIYSYQAIEHLNITSRIKIKKGDCYEIKSRTPSKSNKPFRIYDEIDAKTFRFGWQYGQYLWFDSEEELEQFKLDEVKRKHKEKIEKAKKELIELEARKQYLINWLAENED